ncbi:hypothetical protein Tco_0600049 [Tanacetum coccineum]|uniref:Uncharacterized protein n=1 Tax=Tanacetum coccineum TaxID=301880 RepID=A0ABQ4WAT0_9ASTR
MLGQVFSTEDDKSEILRSLPSAWSKSLCENVVKGSTASSSRTQYVAFVSENTELFARRNGLEIAGGHDFKRMKKFYKKTGRKLQFDAKEPVGFDKTKVECYNCHKTVAFEDSVVNKGNQDNRRRYAWNSGNKDGRRSGKQEDSKALVTIDGEGVGPVTQKKKKIML